MIQATSNRRDGQVCNQNRLLLSCLLLSSGSAQQLIGRRISARKLVGETRLVRRAWMAADCDMGYFFEPTTAADQNYKETI